MAGGRKEPPINLVSRKMVENAMSSTILAAGLGHLPRTEVSEVDDGVYATQEFQVTDYNSSDSEDDLPSPVSSCGSTDSVVCKKRTSTACPKPFHEMANKWDPGFDQQRDSVSKLHSELDWAFSHINKLVDEQRSSKKKLELVEKKLTWQSRVLEKVRAIISEMKGELNRERNNRQIVELNNYKLARELEEAKLSARRNLLHYAREAKARRVVEEVCRDLAKTSVEERDEVEALRKHSMKMCEEFAEERRMLRVTDAWREEMMEMKLRDAKLTLEEKYREMHHLQGELEGFLKTHVGRNPTGVEIQKAVMLRDAVDMVNIQELKEFDGLSGYTSMDRPIANRSSSAEEEDSEDDSGSETSGTGEEHYFSSSLDAKSNASLASGRDWNETTVVKHDWNETVLTQLYMQPKKINAERIWKLTFLCNYYHVFVWNSFKFIFFYI